MYKPLELDQTASHKYPITPQDNLNGLSSQTNSYQPAEIPEPILIQKHQSLTSCASSISIDHQTHFTSQHQLFAQYLFAHHPVSQSSSFELMRKHYEEIQAQGRDQIYSFFGLEVGHMEEEYKVLQYFIGGWLVFAGYGSRENKKYFMSRVRMQVGEERAMKLARVYRNLSLLGLRSANLCVWLLETCRNGWQYFIRKIIQMEQIFQVGE